MKNEECGRRILFVFWLFFLIHHSSFIILLPAYFNVPTHVVSVPVGELPVATAICPPIAPATVVLRLAGSSPIWLHLFDSGSYDRTVLCGVPKAVSPPTTMIRPSITNVPSVVCDRGAGRLATRAQVSVRGSYRSTIDNATWFSSWPV